MARQPEEYRAVYFRFEVYVKRQMKIKVLHVIDSLDLGGAQTLLLEIARHADASRFELEIACMHGLGVFVSEFERAGLRVHMLSPGKWPPHYLPNLVLLLRSLRPDILHFHLFGSNLLAKPTAFLLGYRALVVHDHCNDDARIRSPLLLLTDALANRCASRVIAVAGSIRNFLIHEEAIDPERVTTLSNSVNAEIFVPSDEEKTQCAKKTLGIPPDAFVIGGVGRFVQQKNFSCFLDVAAQLIQKQSDLAFIIAGAGPQGQMLRDKAASLGISGSVRFLGHVSDRMSLYHCMDALLMPSDFEGTPMTLLEAMASGLPVIASGVDGIAEVCTDGHDALLVPPGDLHGYVAALRQIINNKDLRLILGTNARQTILARYEIRSLVRRIESIYDEILSNR